MNFERAIEILNLTFDYTSEDLKKNYHLLMRKYHPDANIGKSEEDLKKLEEKAKEINEAYEFLLKRNKSRELEDIINDYSKILYKYINFNLTNSILQNYYEKIKKTVLSFSNFATKCSSKEDVERFYQTIKKNIMLVYDELLVSYFQKENIDIHYKETLNYDCNLNEFYSQLENLAKSKKKENTDIYLEQLFEQIIRRYTEKISSYQSVNDLTKISFLNNLMGYIVKIFNLVKSGALSIASLKLLENLTFEERVTDLNILISASHNLSTINECSIYLNKTETFGESAWAVLGELDEQLVLRYLYFSKLQEKVITEQDLIENYVPLELFIKEMVPVAEMRGRNSISTMGCAVIYADEDYMIGFKEREMDIGFNGGKTDVEMKFNMPREYQDKEIVKLELIKNIQNKINKEMNRAR